MDCYKVRRVLSAYCDDALSPEQSRDVRLHLAGCRQCATQSDKYSRVRSALRSLPALAPPQRLVMSLRILASRERVRRLSASSMPAFLAPRMARLKLWAEGMMRPLALPMAGGLVSALILFAVLAPTFTATAKVGIADVPTMLSTEATLLGMGPFGYTGEPITVDVSVDSRGSLVDYTLSGLPQDTLRDPEMRRSIENALLFAVISPGTAFGHPVAGKVRITFRRSLMDVKG